MRPVLITAAMALGFLPGCTHWLASARSEPLPADVSVAAELGLIPAARPRPVEPACGPSLVAGDGLALNWAFAHGVIAAGDAGPWRPAVFVMD